MKTKHLLPLLALAAAITSLAFAHEAHNKEKAGNAAGSFITADEAKVSAEWLAKARAEYPLDTCMVSGDKLEGGDMGPPVDYVYRQEDKPDRLVLLCCKHCVRDFKKDPAKYIKMLDHAAAAETKGHSGHKS